MDQVAAVESVLAIVRFREVEADQAPGVVVHSPAVVPAGAQLAPAVLVARPAWDVEVVEVAVVAEGADSEESFQRESQGARIKAMKSQPSNVVSLAVLFMLLTVASSSFSAGWAQAAAQGESSSVPPTNQKGFATPELAAEALITSAEVFDVPTLLEIFGPGGKDFVDTADPVHDKTLAHQFAERARQKHSVTVTNNKATLLVGEEEWPAPIPIVKRQGKWYFDTKAGHNEILYRRIGSNELDAIQICRGYVEAQHEYASASHDGSPVRQYAQKIISTPGKQDGLFWKNSDGTTGGPISEGIAKALEEGYSSKGSPFHGYYFKILKGQGANAPLGELNYVINGTMIGGFAMIAFPAEYKVTGVKTFLVGHDGIVYQKDLGPESIKLAQGMELYNPDKSWRRTNDEMAAQR